ncbi:NAD(+) diphosphatase [Chelativorans sp. Marseille-P2723]|uniref:NAD(+) diphosphatase n=1 Tax=Chelativorans sp. Marseille-P2723 TaxID=2709133 RepID=UPI001571455C|nr:NAD(+) diphosphatase [Chelativorans sp. Marseille-P2723]
MTSSLFSGLDREASRLSAFTGNTLDRRSEHRSEDSVAVALRHRQARIFAVSGGRLLVKFGQGGPDPYFDRQEIERLCPDLNETILLGFTKLEQPRLVVPVPHEPEKLPAHIKAVDFRSLYQQCLLAPDAQGEAAQAASLVAWNATARHCGMCGNFTELKSGGYRRTCRACGKDFFPRTDPVVIMLAVDEGNECCLLGRSPHFRPGMFSCLAGFIEPGETIEDAVRRETLEEANIAIRRVRYHASQPWPFPHTLMIGCYGEATMGEIRRDEAELEDCRWFSRSKVAEMLTASEEDDHSVPPPGSIAHRLISDWCSGDWQSGSKG